MAVLTKAAESVFAPYNIDGSARAIVPQDAQVWGTEIEVTIDALSDAGTLRGGWDASSGVFPGGGTAALGDAWLVETPGTTGGVTFGEGDRIVAIIANASTSLYAGNWQVIRARGRAYIPGTDAGAGTANAIQITTPEPVLDGSVVMFQLFRDTTASPVTISANGGTVLTLKTNRGNAASALTAGMDIWFRYRASDNTARMLNDQDVSALVAQAEAAAASVNLPAAPNAGDFLRRNAGNTAYEALTAAEVVTALNVKALNADGGFTFNTTTTAQDYMPAGTFGGAWKAAHVFASSDASTFVGMRSTLAITREVAGAGGNNPTGDYTLFLTAKNTDLTDSTLGELGVMRMVTFANGRGDKDLFIGTTYKHIGDGTIDEGSASAFEVGTRIFQAGDITNLVHRHQIITAFSPNPTSTWGGRGQIGIYSEHYTGAGYAHFLGIDDQTATGVPTMQYGIALFRQRDAETPYFLLKALTGDIESRTNAAAGVPGPVWTLNHPAAKVAANVAGRINFRGANTSDVAVDYARIDGVVGDPTAGSADGYLSLSAVINNTLTEQLRITDGVDVRTSLKLSGTIRIDASGGLRFPSYAAADIANAAHAVNTSDKVAGKSIWDSTNNRILTASGSATTSSWIVANGTVAINPV